MNESPRKEIRIGGETLCWYCESNWPRNCPHHAARPSSRAQGLHQPIKSKSSATVALQRIVFRALYPRGINGFTYGRPWQDHVPTQNRHLIGEKP